VHRVEGWAGLYKGLMPSIISSLIIILAVTPLGVLFALNHRVGPHGRVYIPLQSGILLWAINFGLSIIPVLLLIPMQILTNRAITTPYKLTAFDYKTAFRVLLSPAERARPALLYIAPGVALADTLEALVTPALALLRYLVVPRLPHFGIGLGAALPVILLTTALLTPLQVALARLTLQRRNGAPAAAAPPEYTEATPTYPEDVVEFRTASEHAAYTGLFDCATKIAREEGAMVLFRAWWVTAILMALPLFSGMGSL